MVNISGMHDSVCLWYMFTGASQYVAVTRDEAAFPSASQDVSSLTPCVIIG